MSSDLNDRLAALKRQYAASFPAKHAEFDAARQAALNGDAGGIADLRDLAHKLAGSGASYGFDEISTLARRLENAAIARQEGDADADISAACEALLARLDAAGDDHG